MVAAVDTDRARQTLQATLETLDAEAAELLGEQSPADRLDASELDQGDAAVELTSIDREQASLEVIEDQRERVRAALQRIENGTYGRCVDCGQELGDERLTARPDAARCLDDQLKAEQAGLA
jgi:DnaK suppressor protein